MRNAISRRHALTGLGTVGIGALVAACAGGDRQGGVTTTAQVPTTSGGTATVQPQTSSDAAVADLFTGTGSCTLTREQTEGPYYFDVDAIRSDIRENRPGVPLRLAIRVQDGGNGCAPLANAVVDLWHCDAGGVYSGFASASGGGRGGAPGGGSARSDDETFLRGAQVTNADGIVQFTTVYPGWYRGRTVHIHAKVHLDNATMLTTQLFFDEAVTDAVYAKAPYTQRGAGDRSNASDPIFDDSLLLTLRQDGDGYLGIITFVVDPD
jgi:protocatechuate 3,4-dioxygenase beta subunit